MAFGYIGALLEGIPLFGLFFMMTNVIGAALWAVELEKSGMAPQFVGVTNIQNPIAQGQQPFSGVSQQQLPNSQPSNSSQPAISPPHSQLQQNPPTTYQGVPPMPIQPVTNYYGPSPMALAHNQVSQATNSTNQIVANTRKQNHEIQISQSPSSSTQRNLPYGLPSTQPANSIPSHQHYGPSSINQPFMNHWSPNSSQPHAHQQQSNIEHQEPPPPYNNPFANG